jgi:hypothetical protein
VQEHLQHPHQARVVNLDARDRRAAGGNREREALEQGKIDVDIEEFGLKAGQAVGRGDERLAQRVELFQRWVERYLDHEMGGVAGTYNLYEYAEQKTYGAYAIENKVREAIGKRKIPMPLRRKE